VTHSLRLHAIPERAKTDNMEADINVRTIIELICGDFEDAWNALAASSDARYRGNFLFGRQAMLLLEVACRLCAGSKAGDGDTNAPLEDLYRCLSGRDRRYFTPLCGTRPSQRDFALPHGPDCRKADLLSVLFDLIRNGQAHQYQQIVVELADGALLTCGLSGAARGLFLCRRLAENGRPRHLRASKSAARDIHLDVFTDLLFLDIRDAICDANLLGRGLEFEHLARGHTVSRSAAKPSARTCYSFGSDDWEKGLRSGGHFQ
jgi:hypothetical protein